MRNMNFESAVNAIAFSALCVAAIFDIKYKRIPNSLVIMVFMLGIARMLIREDYVSCMIGILFPSAVLFALRIYNSTIIGFGDIKLIIAVGFFFGYLRAGMIVLLSLTALLIYALIRQKTRTKETSVCFGPFLAVCSLLGFIV